MKFTTSWDDGYKDDLRLANMLEKHGMTGTFYVCPVPQHTQVMMAPEEIKDLSARHEIGAHSMTHPKLSKIPLEIAREEIKGSKLWVEQVTGKPCTMFCYPYGDCNAEVAQLVQSEGYKGARTVQKYAFHGSDAFMLPTSIHLYPFPVRPVLNRRALTPLKEALPVAREFGITMIQLRGWLPFAKALFQKAYGRKEPWFHLWGHSAEVTKYSMWNQLDSFLDYVSTFQGMEYAPNSSLID